MVYYKRNCRESKGVKPMRENKDKMEMPKDSPQLDGDVNITSEKGWDRKHFRIGKEITKDMTEKEKKRKNVGKAVCVLLLLVFFGWVYSNIAMFHVDIRDYVPKASNRSMNTLDTMGQPKEYVQEFTPSHSDCSGFKIYFCNPRQQATKGYVSMVIKDAKGNEVYNTSIAGVDFNKHKYMRVDFEEIIQLEAGKTYTMTVKSQDALGMQIGTRPEKGDLFQKFTVDGYELNKRMDMNVYYQGYSVKKLAFITVAMIFLLFIVVVPIELDDRWNKIATRILFFASPYMTFWLVERFNDNNIFELEGNFLPIPTTGNAIFLNMLVYFMVLMVLYLITNRARIAAFILPIIFYVLALANYFVMQFRGTPLVPLDFMELNTAGNVAGDYKYKLSSLGIFGIVLLVAFMVTCLKLRSYRTFSWKTRWIPLLVTVCLAGGFSYTFYTYDAFTKWDMDIKIWNPTISYKTHGFAATFAGCTKYLLVEKPENYSLEKVKELAKPYMEDTEESLSDEDKPNIIAIMNEAWTDFSMFSDIDTSEDAMPFIHGLTENTVKGCMYSSVFGGRTANTEFEFLTGNTMAWLPAASVAYTYSVKDPMPAINKLCVEQGYKGNVSIHAYKYDGYNRPAVYSLFGFEHFYCNTDFVNPTYVRAYIDDDSDFKFLISEYEKTQAQDSTKPYFGFSVTMQNHGAYNVEFDNLSKDIQVLTSAANAPNTQRYYNLLKQTDIAFENMVKYFENTDDKTVIIMFGDHQPRISNKTYSYILGKDPSECTLQEDQTRFKIPVVIWANYDIEEEEIEATSANYLGAELFDICGIKLSPYQKFLLDLKKDIPAITGNMYMDNDGVVHTLSDKGEYEKELWTYQMFQYNMFDYDNRYNEFFNVEE